MKVMSIEGNLATVELEGVRKEAATDLYPAAAVGDWVLIHTGFIIERLDEADAMESLKLWKELEEAASEDT